MKVNLGKIELKNPLIIASGTGGYGTDKDMYYYSRAGAFITKTITYETRAGNPPPRVLEVNSGIMNSVGLENPGIENFIEYLDRYCLDTVLIVSISVNNLTELKSMVKQLEKIDKIQGYELNPSCPNVKHKEIMPFLNKKYIKDILKEFRKRTDKFISVKLPPYTGIKYARFFEKNGADALTVSNTYPGIAFYGENNFLKGGVSGPAIKPLMLYNVFQISHIVKIPVIASGGICSASDVKEALKIGASAVQLGSINMIHPDAVGMILKGLYHFSDWK